MERGLVAEVQGLVGQALSRTAREAIGYREVFAHFAGEIPLLDDAFDADGPPNPKVRAPPTRVVRARSARAVDRGTMTRRGWQARAGRVGAHRNRSGAATP